LTRPSQEVTSLTSPKDMAVGISHTGSSKDTVYALNWQTTQAHDLHYDHRLSPYPSRFCLFTATGSHFHEERIPNLATLALKLYGHL
jgi:hypothetical protein